MGAALWYEADVPKPLDLELGMNVTLLSHPKYKGLIGKPLTVQAIELPFVVVDYNSILGDVVNTVIDTREAEFMPITEDYVDTVNGDSMIRIDYGSKTVRKSRNEV